MKYAILDTSGDHYDAILAAQKKDFDMRPGATNFEPILNIAGSRALIPVFEAIPQECRDCVLEYGGEEVPQGRDMLLWETPTV